MDRLGTALRVGLILPLLIVAAQPLTARANPSSKHSDREPNGLPRSEPGKIWRYVIGTPRADTLFYPPQDILPVARRQLQNDKWEIFDESRGRIVTLWKQMHHPLVILFMGKVNARCTVTMTPLGPNRTRMVFQGDLASHRDLNGNPMLGAARRAYAKGARDYVAEVRDYLDTHRRMSSIR